MSALSLPVDSPKFSGTFRRSFLLPGILLALLAGLVIWQISTLLSAIRWLDRSSQVLVAMAQADHDIDDEATAVHSELLTRQPSFREEFEQFSSRTEQQIRDLKVAVGDSPTQMENLSHIAAAHERWAAESRRQMAGSAFHAADAGWSRGLNSLHSSWQQAIRLEETLKAERMEKVSRQTRVTLALLSALCLLLCVMSYALSRRGVHRVTAAYTEAWEEALGAEPQKEEHESGAKQQIEELSSYLEQTSQQLRRRERELKQAQRLAGLGSWEMDFRTGAITWSEELFRIFGVDPSKGAPTLEEHDGLFCEGGWSALKSCIELAVAEDKPYEIELDVLRPEGGCRRILAKGEADRSPNGDMVRLHGTVQDITERKILEDRLSFQAYHDLLTGLPNRELLQQRLEDAIHLGTAAERLTGVLYIDVDNFKFLNDTLGHPIGDLFLKSIAQRICESVRVEDTVARIGGDEFVVVCYRLASEAELEAIANRIITEVRRPHQIGGTSTFISLSIGIAVGPRDGTNVHDLLKSADLAMYQAKQVSRDTYVFHTPEMIERVNTRVEIEKDLRHAIEREEFLLYYQPRIDLVTGRITGLESLIRWQHPSKGLVMPGNFIDVAEASGLIVPMGEWALDTACRQTQAWRKRGLIDFPVAVNVSIAQLKRKTFVQSVETILRRYELPASSIEIEITESLLLEDADLFARQIRDLKDLGLFIAIDDFGTRYSNLNYLKKLPVDTLKIDQSFVHDIDRTASDAAICRSIIALAQNLNLRTVGEGVERYSELAYLRQFGCDDMQGFLLCRPQPQELIERQLNRTFDLHGQASEVGEILTIS
ncbi:diguanylate cyclase (GGDEF)-like protein [Acidipila rosea]|uniref:Diguanylate cyclase (GGDEF)-like protein n=1 Tax=Acidipila rosea TaxID=768535 RepID=A0A4R1LBS6_9BACT|nr:diguanylate cyclase (GGDEF)-like protein [Acidipila rosea]